MKENVQSIVSSAIVRLLRPLIRILLRSNVPYGTFADLAKWVYVDVAAREFTLPGKKTSISRTSIITGLSRKEVKRLQQISEPDDLGTSERYNRAARVVGGWLKEPRFTDEEGNPKELPFEDHEVSFSALVKAYSGDVPPRAVLDELLRVGVVKRNTNGIRLLVRGYIVNSGDVDKLSIMGTDVGELISTIHHNVISNPSDAFLQRKVSYDNIPENVHADVKNMIFERGKEFVEIIDRQIARYDRDNNPDLKGEGRRAAGFGIFYFEK
jgi:hypothetical protein